MEARQKLESHELQVFMIAPESLEDTLKRYGPELPAKDSQ